MFALNNLLPVSYKREKYKKALIYILSFTFIFAVSFCLSYFLASSSQNNQDKLNELKSEITHMQKELNKKDETIASLNIQIENLKKDGR